MIEKLYIFFSKGMKEKSLFSANFDKNSFSLFAFFLAVFVCKNMSLIIFFFQLQARTGKHF